MNTLIKLLIVVACAMALMYFDSLDNKPKEQKNARNSHMGTRDWDFRIRIGNLRLYRFCLVPTKQGNRQVKCPICKTWTKNPNGYYECDNIKRILIVEQIKKGKKHELARTDH